MAKLKPPPLLPQIRASLKFDLSLSLSLSLKLLIMAMNLLPFRPSVINGDSTWTVENSMEEADPRQPTGGPIIWLVLGAKLHWFLKQKQQEANRVGEIGDGTRSCKNPNPVHARLLHRGEGKAALDDDQGNGVVSWQDVPLHHHIPQPSHWFPQPSHRFP